MEPNAYIDSAVTYFDQGYSCSQSLFMAYAPLLSIEVEQAAWIAAPFGGGVGGLGGACGAVTGALMALGAWLGINSAGDVLDRTRASELAKRFQLKFIERNGTVVCRELIGRDISNLEQLALAREEGIFEMRCPKFVQDAAEIIGEMIGLELELPIPKERIKQSVS